MSVEELNPVNTAPTANPQSVTTNQDTALPITLTGSDLETAASSLTFTVTASPSHGTLRIAVNGPSDVVGRSRRGARPSADWKQESPSSDAIGGTAPCLAQTRPSGPTVRAVV